MGRKDHIVLLARQNLEARLFRLFNKCKTEEEVHVKASMLRRVIDGLEKENENDFGASPAPL